MCLIYPHIKHQTKLERDQTKHHTMVLCNDSATFFTRHSEDVGRDCSTRCESWAAPEVVGRSGKMCMSFVDVCGQIELWATLTRFVIPSLRGS